MESIKLLDKVPVDHNKVTVGETYKVLFEDCCVDGEFTFKIVKKTWNEEGWLDDVEFENGVIITLFVSVSFYETN
ncbi:MAG TPA: hypothetical protein ENI23_16130 [bacterium]|nr:hypothetical protein [bacterium]